MPKQPNRNDDCPKNCSHDCPTGLINWPPSRGVKPHCMSSLRGSIPKYFEPERVDVERPPRPKIEIKHMVDGEEVSSPIAAMKTKMPRFPSKKERRMSKEKRDKKNLREVHHYRFNHHVSTVATLSVDQARKLIHGLYKKTGNLSNDLPTPREIEVTISYPLNLYVKLKIKPYEAFGKERMAIGYILWSIAKEYERIYEEHEKYGVWGHEMSDLYFEGLVVEGNLCELHIGS